ncbi:MAG: amidohydrolase family protein [Candidatus Dormibacteria bacterium]
MGQLDVRPGPLAGVIVDAHVHVLPDRVRADLPRITAGEPWFAACHAGGRRVASVESAVAAMDMARVDRAVIFTWPFADPQLCREGNDYIAAAQRRFPDRVIGFGTVQPAFADAAAEVRRCARLGLRGIGELNADAQGWELEGGAVEPVVAASLECELPWTLHCSEAVGRPHPGRGTATPDRIVTFAQRHEDLRLICAHLGGGLPLQAHTPQVQDICRRLWFDTAAAPFLHAPGVYRSVVDLCGAERLLLGSDHPLLDVPRYAQEFAGAGLTVAETRLVMGDAAAALLL